MNRLLVATALLMLAGCGGNSLEADEIPLEQIRLPPGFRIGIFADNVPNARGMALGDSGTVFVASRREGKVHALRDINRDGRADVRHLIASGLNNPNGVAFRRGALYIAETDRIQRFDAIEAHLHDPPDPVIIRDDLPAERHHGWRPIAFGPDDRLYIGIGAPCNVCLKKEFGQIRSMKPDGSDEQLFAEGVRNTVGFDWHPQTGALWFTDNGRDWLGDDLPPDELNRAESPGLHFGFPFCHGGNIPDPEFGRPGVCRKYEPPVQALGAHVAPLGVAFYTGRRFPGQYQNQILIAEHGSWNRSKKAGYRVSLVRLEGNRPISHAPFAKGWLQDERAWGRPAFLLVMKDGVLLVSDDYAGVIYRIDYSGSAEED